MDVGQEGRSAPGWFKLAAIAVLVWELIGCSMYLLQVTADHAALPADQRAMWEATPHWSVAAYAVAVWVGLAGAILLLIRRRLAEPLLLVSLIAAVAQFSALALSPELRAVTPSGAWGMPIGVILVCLAVWLFARHSKRQGWLR